MNRTWLVGGPIRCEDGAYGTTESIFSGGPRAGDPDGAGARSGAPDAVGSARLYRGKAGLYGGDLATVVRQTERDSGHRVGLTTDERQRLKELERQNLHEWGLRRV